MEDGLLPQDLHISRVIRGVADDVDRLESPLVAALTELALMLKPRERERIRKALGDEVTTLATVVPALNILEGSSPKPLIGVHNFAAVLRLALGAVCSQERPLAMILENDASMEDLLLSLVEGVEGLFIVVTCVKEGSRIPVVPSTRLCQNDLEQWLKPLVSFEADAIRLAAWLMQHSDGRRGRIIEILRLLQTKQILRLHDGRWEMDPESLVDIDGCHEDYGPFRETSLQYAACLGYYFSLSSLEFVIGKSGTIQLEEAKRNGMLVPWVLPDHWMFVDLEHHRAAYESIQYSNRRAFHMKVGRRLWKYAGCDASPHAQLEIAAHLRTGNQLDEMEVATVATLCLEVAKNATSVSLFDAAECVLGLGMTLMEEPRWWHDEYDLKLATHTLAAQTYLSASMFKNMEDQVSIVLREARCLQDKLPVYKSLIYARSIGQRPKEAIELATGLLRELGVRVPHHISRLRLVADHWSIRKQLQGKSNEQLLRLPMMTDANAFEALHILNLIFLPSSHVDQKIFAFALLKMMSITLEQGKSILTGMAFISYGVFAVHVLRNLEEGDRFGQLGLQFLDEHERNEYWPRSAAGYYGMICFKLHDIAETLAPLKSGQVDALMKGDYIFAGTCGNLYCAHLFEVSSQLEVVEREYERLIHVMESKKVLPTLLYAKIALNAVKLLMGGRDESETEEEGALLPPVATMLFDANALSLRHTTYRIMVLCVMDQVENVETDVVDLFGRLGSYVPTIERVHSTFFCGLVAIERARYSQRWRYLRLVRKILRTKLSPWADANPRNFLDKCLLLEAELDSYRGRNSVAYRHFVASSSAAQAVGNRLYEALAKERTARHFQRTGDEKKALHFLQQAEHVYRDWGATAKSVLLRDEIDAKLG